MKSHKCRRYTYLLKTLKVFCSFRRFILSPPRLGYSFAGVAIPYRVLHPTAAGVFSGRGIASPADGNGTSCSQPPRPSQVRTAALLPQACELQGRLVTVCPSWSLLPPPRRLLSLLHTGCFFQSAWSRRLLDVCFLLSMCQDPCPR